MAKPWTNADGLQVKFANYWNDRTNFANKVWAINDLGVIKQAVMDYDLSLITSGTVAYSADLNNDGTADGFHDGDFRLPANASVLRVTLIATEAAAGGTSFILGTYKKDGTAIDDDGLITVTEGVLANVNAVGKRVYGAGAYVASTAGTAGVGTVNAYVGLKATGTFTAGKGKILIEYIDGGAEALAD